MVNCIIVIFAFWNWCTRLKVEGKQVVQKSRRSPVLDPCVLNLQNAAEANSDSLAINNNVFQNIKRKGLFMPDLYGFHTQCPLRPGTPCPSSGPKRRRPHLPRIKVWRPIDQRVCTCYHHDPLSGFLYHAKDTPQSVSKEHSSVSWI